MNDFDTAIADLGEAIRLDPKFADAYGSRGWAWDQKRAFDKAIADFNEAVRLDPKFAYAHKSRAWLLATCPDAKYRDGKKAVQSATTACELSEWKDPGALDTLAAAHAEAGAFEPAVKWESRAIELVSDDEAREIYRNRLELYRQKKPFRATNP
jgi:tetratricopeptide (TPR) repeat protein